MLIGYLKVRYFFLKRDRIQSHSLKKNRRTITNLDLGELRMN